MVSRLEAIAIKLECQGYKSWRYTGGVDSGKADEPMNKFSTWKANIASLKTS